MRHSTTFGSPTLPAQVSFSGRAVSGGAVDGCNFSLLKRPHRASQQ